MFNTKSPGVFLGDFITETISYMLCITYYNKTNYELAYRVRQLDDLIIIVIMAGTRENFYNELKRYIKVDCKMKLDT